MPTWQRILIGLLGTALLIALAAVGSPLARRILPIAGDNACSTVSKTPMVAQPGGVVWGRVPY